MGSKMQCPAGLDFGGSLCQDYVEALLQFNQLESFYILDCSNVGDAGLRLLVEAIIAKPSIRNFGAKRCNITDKTMEYFRDDAPDMLTLDYLEFGTTEKLVTPGTEDEFTDSGAKWL